MSAQMRVSGKTIRTWLIDAVAFVAGLVSILTGIYFLYLPSGGYEGGRNSMYGITILFSRHTWEGLHTWSSVVMIAALVIHMSLHWAWVRMSGRRVANHLTGKRRLKSELAMFNIAINAVTGISFLVCALSGMYFLFAPSGGFQGGRNLNWDPSFLFSRITWDLIHTSSGVVMSSTVVVHFAIHWRWVNRVTSSLLHSLRYQPALDRAPAVN